VLTADDIDGNISNGTPNFARSVGVPRPQHQRAVRGCAGGDQAAGDDSAVITTGSQPLTVPVTISAGDGVRSSAARR
jgi:hypothetical protein